MLFATAPVSARLLGARTAIEATARPISGSSAFSLPSSTSCVSGHTLTVRLRKVPHIVWTAERIKVDGKLVRVVTRAHVGRAVTLTGLPSGKFVVAILATTSRRRTATLIRVYRACSAGVPVGSRPYPLGKPIGLGFIPAGPGGDRCDHQSTPGTVWRQLADAGPGFKRRGRRRPAIQL